MYTEGKSTGKNDKIELQFISIYSFIQLLMNI